MKRSRDEILARILEVCAHGANKTKIVYQVNTNFRTIIPYIERLVKSELITVKEGPTVLYETTPKGFSFLESYKRIEETLFDR